MFSRNLSRPVRRRSFVAWMLVLLISMSTPFSIATAQDNTPDESSPSQTISKACASELIDSGEGDRAVVAVPELNLRSGPGIDCGVIAELERDTSLLILGKPQERDGYAWVPVSTALGAGFVVIESIQIVGEQATCTKGPGTSSASEQGFAADVVNLRSGAGLGCSVLAELSAGTPVTIMGDAIEADGERWIPVSTPLGDGFIYTDGYAPPGSWSQPVAVAVLMYHDIGEATERYRVAPWQLEQQLIWLRDNGYASITPRDLIANIDTGAPLPPRPVILSIDDGWASALIFRDLLAAYGFKGTYFLPNYAELTPETIWALNQYGEVCGHTVSHQFLDQMSYDGQVYEVGANKAWLDSILGTSTTCFAYPFGSYSDVTTQVVAGSGYRIAFDAWKGVQYFDGSLDRWHVNRIEVSGYFDLGTFASVVAY